RRDRHEQKDQRRVAHDAGIPGRRQHLDADEEVTRDRTRAPIVAFGADPQLGPVLDPWRNQKPDAPLRLNDSLTQALPAFLSDTPRTVFQLKEVRKVESERPPPAAGPTAELAFRVRQSHRAAPHARLAAQGGLVLHDRSRPLDGFEAL